MKTLKEQFKHVEKLIFYPLAIVLLLGVILGFAIPEAFSAGASALLSTILNSFSAFFIVISGVALLFAFAFCCTPFSKRVIGGPDQKPTVNTFSYICIITTGSIGSTILFWGVAEPLMHFTSPPTALGLEAGTAAAASAAIAYPTINWAFVYFAFIALWSVGMGHMCIDHGLPFRPSSALWPILKGWVFKWPGKIVDVICLFALVGGIVCSFGVGTTQIAAGMEYAFGLKPSNLVYALIILFVAAGFTTSSSLGVKKGIQRIADLNGWFYIALCLYLLFAGPTQFLVNLGVEAVGDMLNVIPYFTNTDPFMLDNGWSMAWEATNLVWGCIYTPVTAMFFISISRGRTYRQMVLMTMIPTTLFCMILFLLFGGNALYLQEFGGMDILGTINEIGVPASAYLLFEQFSIGKVAGPVLLFTLLISFITMADNMTYSMAQLTSKTLDGEYAAGLPLRIFWAALICGMTMVCLLMMGSVGMNGIQSVAVSTGLPFYFVMILALICIVRITTGKAEKDLAEWRSVPGNEALIGSQVVSGGETLPSGEAK